MVICRVDAAVKRCNKRFAVDTSDTGVPISPPGSGGAGAMIDRLSQRQSQSTDDSSNARFGRINLLIIYKIQTGNW